MELFELYRDLNDRLFNSELPDVDVIFMDGLKEAHQKMTGHKIDIYGMFDSEAEVIGLDYDQNYLVLLNTLIHEMIHVWQWIKGYTDFDHGKTFNRKSRKVLEILDTDLLHYGE